MANREDEHAWAWESATVLPPVADPHVVVQIRLTADEFEELGPAAERKDVGTAEYVRRVVQERLQRRSGEEARP